MRFALTLSLYRGLGVEPRDRHEDDRVENDAVAAEDDRSEDGREQYLLLDSPYRSERPPAPDDALRRSCRDHLCLASFGGGIEFRPNSVYFFPESLTFEGSSGCIVALHQVIERAEMGDGCG